MIISPVKLEDLIELPSVIADYESVYCAWCRHEVPKLSAYRIDDTQYCEPCYKVTIYYNGDEYI